MKILLDECVTKKLKSALDRDDVSTVTEMGWGGIKNGKLLKTAVSNNFDMLLTIDKNMEYQQSMRDYPLVVVVFDVKRNKVEEYLPLLEGFYKKRKSFVKGKAYKITA